MRTGIRTTEPRRERRATHTEMTNGRRTRRRVRFEPLGRFANRGSSSRGDLRSHLASSRVAGSNTPGVRVPCIMWAGVRKKTIRSDTTSRASVSVCMCVKSEEAPPDAIHARARAAGGRVVALRSRAPHGMGRRPVRRVHERTRMFGLLICDVAGSSVQGEELAWKIRLEKTDLKRRPLLQHKVPWPQGGQQSPTTHVQ